MKYANQKTITVNREIPSRHSREARFIIYRKNLEAAASNLSGVAFKLYCYIASFGNGYSLDFSPQDFITQYGVSINAARDAVHTLIDKGYLVEIKENEYIFNEVPDDWEYC